MKATAMDEKKKLNEDLIWLCFVDYVKTYEQAGESSPADDSRAIDDDFQHES